MALYLIAPWAFAQTNNGSSNKGKPVKLSADKVKLVNRQLDREKMTEPGVFSLNAGEGSGMAVVKSAQVGEGTIHIDLRGENNPGRSFVGVAFNIQNDSTYEAVYFRPFNFLAKAEASRQHGIQYIYHPKYPWDVLRKEREGEFEAAFDNPPNPDGWFSVSINILPDRVVVKEPESGRTLLEVDRLANTASKKIGLWVGNGSIGSFRNLGI